MKRIACVLLVIVPVAVSSLVRAEDKPSKTPAVVDRPTLEKEFTESLSGATLVGYFTTNGTKETGLKEEKYKLKNVKKLRGDTWLFEYQYGDKGVAIPLPLEVKWAGDTPVITLTDAAIPGVGTFTARVLFYRGEYAGTWSAGADHGGKLFGKIVKEDADENEDEDKDEKDE
ncbi:MAG TPA: hypothetical protein VND64_17810 [Pirellulales bacterium]|nr:hypothetical protein [Pirellulales bacterium]